VTGSVPEISFTSATIYGYVNNSAQAALGMGIAYAPTALTGDITKVRFAHPPRPRQLIAREVQPD